MMFFFTNYTCVRVRVVIIGVYSFKEEVQLKAPTDLSLFERLKGSLKSFLNRHVSSQVYRTLTRESEIYFFNLHVLYKKFVVYSIDVNHWI